MTENLEGLTNAELVGVYNALNPDKPLSAWKGKKDVLISRIGEQRKKVLDGAKAIEPKAEAAEEPVTVREADVEAGHAVPDAERTIRQAALELLCHVDYYEDRTKKSADDNRVGKGSKNARSVGLPYDEVIRRIQQEFPDCQTTVACLRWYSVKVRVEEHGYEGLKLPQRRPRVKPRRA
jgi:hypothetical protein